jgi:hypothetical protein
VGTLLVAVVKLKMNSGGVPKVAFGKDSVSYAAPETKERAVRLGQFLQSIGVFADKGTNVLLSKDAKGPILEFLVADGAWNNPDVDESFEEIGRRAAPVAGGYPVRVRLADSKKAVHKELLVDRVVRDGQDEIYFCGSATATDANALADALEKQGYLQKKGDIVELRKGAATTLAFTVRREEYKGPSTAPSFEKLTRSIAESVGGVPVKLQLARPDGGVFYESLVR